MDTIEATSRLHRRCSGTKSAAEARPHKHRHHRHIITPALFSQPVQEQWLFGGFQSGFNVPLPLILPGRVLPGNGEVRNIFPHLDEA